MRTITIEQRFRGPERSGNGGYTCGLLAAELGRDAEVTLRRPPPLERPLRVVPEDERLCLCDGEDVVAECVPASVDLDPPPAVGWADAEQASRRYPGFERHPFPTCFVCGPRREPGDGLRIYPGPLGHGELVAAPWIPDSSLADEDGRVRLEFAWAALDCPGAYAVGAAGRGEVVLGRLAAHVDERPEVGRRHVVVGWPLGGDGRKLYAGTALNDGERVLAVARATWIVPRA